MWSPGRNIDRYVLEAPLADDPGGAWWRVQHRLTGSQHLLRLFAREASRDVLLRSIRIQGKAQHPQLLRATDCFEDEGRICLVTDLVELQNLADHLRKGALTPADAHRVLKGLAGAVGALHAQGVQHLDLQPARILWCGGTPRIADFRLARTAGDPVQRGGNPAYLAPEMAEGNPDARADIYALGCIAYELLKGTPLFSGMADPTRKAPPLAEFPPSWITLLDRCLRMEPGGRYPHAGAMVRAMEEGEPRKEEVRAEPAKGETPKGETGRLETPKAEPAKTEPPRPEPRAEAPRPVTPVTVEEERRVPRPASPEPEVSTRWGTVLALGLLIGMLTTVCIGGLGLSWWFTQRPVPVAQAVPAEKPRVDTGTPAAPAPSSAKPASTRTVAGTPPVRTGSNGAPVASSTGAASAPVPAAPAPAAPASPETPANGIGHTIVTFEGTTVPPTVEVTCRGGFRTRAKVSGQKVEVEGMPADAECLMFLKDVVATPAPIRANRNYTCKVTGTTTSCK